MLLSGFLMMGFFLFLVGGLQARFGHWGIQDGSRTSLAPDFAKKKKKGTGC